MDPNRLDDVMAVVHARAMTLQMIRLRDTDGKSARLIYDDELRRLIRQCRRLAKSADDKRAVEQLEWSGRIRGSNSDIVPVYTGFIP